MRIAVVIATYNGAPTLPDAIESLLGQSVAADEIIVVDDGSTDGSAEIASRYPVTVLHSPQNQGVASARNRGIRATGAGLIAFLDSDCIAPSDWLQRIREHFESDPDLAALGGRGTEQHRETWADEFRSRFCAMTYGDTPRRVLHLFGLCSAYRRDAILEVGPFNPFFLRKGEEVDLGYKLTRAGKKIRYDPELFVYHERRDTPASLLRSCYQAHYYGKLAKLANYGSSAREFLRSFLGVGILAGRQMVDAVAHLRIRLIPISLALAVLRLKALCVILISYRKLMEEYRSRQSE